MPYGTKPKKLTVPKAAAPTLNRRHAGSAEAKKLGRGAHVSAHSSTHMKSRMKRY